MASHVRGCACGAACDRLVLYTTCAALATVVLLDALLHSLDGTLILQVEHILALLNACVRIPSGVDCSVMADIVLNL